MCDKREREREREKKKKKKKKNKKKENRVRLVVRLEGKAVGGRAGSGAPAIIGGTRGL